MKTAHRRYLFGIFSREQHAYGAIFTLDAKGDIEEYYPIDFHGTDIKKTKKEEALAGILMPITETSALAMKSFMGQLAADIAQKNKRFYFVERQYNNQGYNPEYERKDCNPILFDGSQIELSPKITSTFAKSPESPPLIGTNCLHFLMNLAIHIGKIPLTDINHKLAPSFSVKTVNDVAEDCESDKMLLGFPIDGYRGHFKEVHASGVATFYMPCGDEEMPHHSWTQNWLAIPDDLDRLQLPDGTSLIRKLAQHPPLQELDLQPTGGVVTHIEAPAPLSRRR